ncbi:porin [Bradyrhizobium canariense]|uniref:Porin n=1 Tax=Bradyrhizobium canariense TaxID=255045 RepID=A0A1X3H3H3_9BRAD|nr:porin [Bradyrhizobium canariense]OSI68663.1 porin [Bradyrhizobium canariense]OSI78111.1 porin [Bradyrhizobium canariense]OSI89341.1 porin [Bradyrhizobium canariense]OSI93171.1 porin [Bradyrhizobium canariense]OSJ03140.1 porin [Bradyrhizobium canariense]
MKVMKGIILASAAMFVGAGAHAADLPVKAKAIEYVKICSLYGAGFYYIPGTDTCIKLGGYLRADALLATSSDLDFGSSGVAGARNRLSNYYTTRTRQDLQIDTRTATEYGVVRTFAELVFTWTSGTYSGAGSTGLNGATSYTSSLGSQVAGGSLGVYYAFIQFAGFTFGKAESQFRTPWAEYPANNIELPGSGGWDPVNQVTYTADFGQGITASFSAQDQVANYTSNIWNVSGATAVGQVTGAYGANDIGGSRAPDLVARLRVDQAWGLFQASVAAHDNHAAYYGASEVTGHPDDKWGWAGQLALSIKNLPTGPGDTINLTGVYTYGASRYNFQDYMSTAYAIYGGTNVAGAYQSLGIGGVSDSVFVAGAGQELTTTYGFNGGYTHNWDPYWNSSVFGAWAAVRYNNTAKGYICGAFVANLALSTGVGGCNPDFNYAVVGTKTSWTPVKGLTFTGELAYLVLDQKYASGSTVTLPLQAGVAKPAAVYELKDQNSLVMMLRAQRNF